MQANYTPCKTPSHKEAVSIPHRRAADGQTIPATQKTAHTRSSDSIHRPGSSKSDSRPSSPAPKPAVRIETDQPERVSRRLTCSIPSQSAYNGQRGKKDVNKAGGSPVYQASERRISLLNDRVQLHLRGYDDDESTDWWFASTAIPLLAAAIAPLANVLSIAALVMYWRVDLRDPDHADQLLPDFEGILYRDPRWAYWLNLTSLICGFAGNFFLLLNFTGRICYIIALPFTIILWYAATGILLTVTITMHIYVPPEFPLETYSQGYWYAVMATCLYFVCSVLLMFNMLGYFLGHYPQRFKLNDHQRTLILQTMLFFIWLAGGAAVFAAIESHGDQVPDWTFVDGLYFCDVTILTLGFGDLVVHNDLGRGLVFPYTVGGIIMLGLVISSISKFASELGRDNVVQKHRDRIRSRTLQREISNSPSDDPERVYDNTQLSSISSPFHLLPFAKNAKSPDNPVRQEHREAYHHFHTEMTGKDVGRKASELPFVDTPLSEQEDSKHQSRAVKFLHEEQDRFDQMRHIQEMTAKFKRWWSLTLSITAFLILWCVGATIFWLAERDVQGMSYFQSLYFCYVSLLTIGYGDFAPKSNAGRPFFVVWSLIAVPTMTLLINAMSGTVIDAFKRLTFSVADFTLLLKKNVYSDWLHSHPGLGARLKRWEQKSTRGRRMMQGLRPHENNDPTSLSRPISHSPVASNEERDNEEKYTQTQTTEMQQDREHLGSEEHLAYRLAIAIRHVVTDLHAHDTRRYTFEEWAQFTSLMQFSTETPHGMSAAEDDHTLDWDWLGYKSPMMSNKSETEFLLDRLCQSLVRCMSQMERKTSRLNSAQKPTPSES